MHNSDSSYVQTENALYADASHTITYTKAVTRLNFHMIAIYTSTGDKGADIQIFSGGVLKDTYDTFTFSVRQ